MLTRWIQQIWTFGPVKVKVIITACLLAIVPIAILGMTTYLLASHTLFKEIGKANRETVKQVQERIDDKLVNLDKVVLQHAFNPLFKEFLSLDKPYEDPTRFQAIMTILTSMEGLINDTDGVYLYMTRQNLIVNPSQGIADASRLHPSVLEQIQKHNEDFFWMDRIRSVPSIPRGGTHVVTFVRKLPVSAEKPLGYLIIELNDRALFDVFSHMQFGQSGEMLIVTPTGNILSDWNKHLLEPDFSNPVLQRLTASDASEEMYSATIHNQELLINYLKSDYNGWRYVSAVPIRELTSSIQWIKRATLAASLMLVLISIGAAVTLSGSFVRRLTGIIDLIRKKHAGLPIPQAGMNEFGLLRHYMESLHTANRHLEQQMLESMPLLRANFLQKLVTGTLDAKDVEEKLRYYGIEMPAAYYTVLYVELDHMRGQTEQDVQLFTYAAMNIAKELLVPRGHGAVFQTQTDHIAVVLNHGSESSSPHELKTNAFILAEELRDVIHSLLRITVTIGIGHCYRGLEQLKLSRKEAEEALQYQMVQGCGKVIYIGSMLPKSSSYEYPIEQEQYILTGIKLGALEQVGQQVDAFAARLTHDQESGSYEYVQQAFVQLMAASLKTLFELDPEQGPKLFHYNVYQRLGRMRTSEAIVKWLKEEIYPTLIQHIIQRRNVRQRRTMEKVLDYIHEHYDEDLSQPLLADMASLPNSQFSHVFKAETGMTLTDYIIAYRMEKAKELLRGTDLKIAEIAERLCYNNPQNFIRGFKRLCGITPGEYRSRSVAEAVTE
ncbi:helix-turn-helix domain-containing protein [Paenibacillus sp. TAB 01]|uniref:helix-turn-helix domain-containing protein n=1 Tax=Paenibacillus sp. TAB 01 TaxID=3368988 RepID=UPI003751262E